MTLNEFRKLYGGDLFYSWFGLDNPLMFAAHKAAGGITSLYRQIGTGCEKFFRQLIQDRFTLTPTQAGWSYSMKVAGQKKERKLSLDGRIALTDLNDKDKMDFSNWLGSATKFIGTDPAIASALKGAVFEVRQGYKSKDSKRQNADIGNAGTAYTQGYLPVVTILSNQIDGDVAERYMSSGWLLLRGNLSDSPLDSTYAFCKEVLGFDAAEFLSETQPS